MKIIDLKPHAIKKGTIAAIGFFDGVHKAHEVLIDKVIERGRKENLRKAVITFDDHPKSVLFDIDHYYITPFDHKIRRLQAFDLDEIYVIRFDKDVASMDPRSFIDAYLDNLSVLICGFDFKFGARASGDVGLLKSYAEFETDIVDKLTVDGYKIGSSLIRDLIRGGKVDDVPQLLGSYYRIRGNVMHGLKKGRTIDYPTANIDCGEYLIPKRGVYATMTLAEGTWYHSMSSVGFNPTLNPRDGISVESYLFDFEGELYGKPIETVFIKRLRDEKKFESAAALKAQIDQDGSTALELLKGLKDDARIYQ